MGDVELVLAVLQGQQRGLERVEHVEVAEGHPGAGAGRRPRQLVVAEGCEVGDGDVLVVQAGPVIGGGRVGGGGGGGAVPLGQFYPQRPRGGGYEGRGGGHV